MDEDNLCRCPEEVELYVIESYVDYRWECRCVVCQGLLL